MLSIFDSGLALRFSMAQATRHYQLVYVGAVRAKQAVNCEPEVMAYFQELHPGRKASSTAPLLEQPIPIQLAASLLVGSKWSPEGEMLSDGTDTYPDSRSLLIGECKPKLFKLAQLFPLDNSQPDFIKRLPQSSWYAVVNTETERLLIPCFELLRTFCYQAAGLLTSFLFSRLPLETLCWPISSPTKENAFTAHFCVASSLVKLSEARILAELLFNTPYHDSIRFAHASIGLQWHRCQARKKDREAHVKIPLKLGKSVQVTAHGFPFISQEKSYFWVSQLKPVGNWYSFKKVVFHPLRTKRLSIADTQSPFSLNRQGSFEDVLRGRRSRPVISLVAELFKSTKHLKLDHRLTSTTSQLPLVVRSFSWAKRMPLHAPPAFAEASILHSLWARPSYLPDSTQTVLPENNFFHEVVHYLRLAGCTVNIMNINNYSGVFGANNSLLPYACAPSSYTHLPDGRYRPISIAHIEWGGGNFYLFNLLGNAKFALSSHGTLKSWSLDEYNKFLRDAIQINFDWQYSNKQLYFIMIDFQTAYLLGDGAEEVAKSCYIEVKNMVARYNEQIDFKKKARDYMKKYPHIGEAYAEGVIHDKKVAGYYPGNRIGEDRAYD